MADIGVTSEISTYFVFFSFYRGNTHFSLDLIGSFVFRAKLSELSTFFSGGVEVIALVGVTPEIIGSRAMVASKCMWLCTERSYCLFFLHVCVNLASTLKLPFPTL